MASVHVHGTNVNTIADLHTVLNATLQQPCVLAINSMLGRMLYSYRFRTAPANGRYHQSATREAEAQAETIDSYVGAVEIRRLPTGRAIVNPFKLIRISPTAYVLVCTKLYNSANVSPPISIPIEYRRRSRCWVATSTFNNIRAVFSLNSHEDSFGLFASICTTEMTVTIAPDSTLTITCYGPMGYVLNQANTDDRDPTSSDTYRTHAHAHAYTRQQSQSQTPSQQEQQQQAHQGQHNGDQVYRERHDDDEEHQDQEYSSLGHFGMATDVVGAGTGAGTSEMVSGTPTSASFMIKSEEHNAPITPPPHSQRSFASMTADRERKDPAAPSVLQIPSSFL